ncbi:MAG: hypothetical protein HYX24_03365 [Candidatus Aenigmarchaeota archaeon]|nr:hypothetical protein [Candidatus Aenigmarchaeota archaeon]
MGIFDFISPGFMWGWRVKGLRRKWDRLREKALNKKRPLRDRLLEKLDTIENNLRTIEETSLNRVTAARIAKEVEIDMEEIKEILRARESEMQDFEKGKYQEKNKSQ